MKKLMFGLLMFSLFLALQMSFVGANGNSSLNSPSDNIFQYENPVTFNATLNAFSDYNITSAELYVWDNAGDLYYTNLTIGSLDGIFKNSTANGTLSNNGDSVSQNVGAGWEIIPTENIYLTNVYSASSNPNKILLQNSSGDTLESASLVGSVANIPYLLESGKTYRILATNDGGSWTSYRTTSPTTFPYYNSTVPEINVTAVFDNSGNRVDGSQNWWSINKIEFEGVNNLGTTNTTTWDVDLEVGSYTWNVLGSFANGTDSTTSFASSNYSLTYGFDINNESYDATATESENIDFSLNFSVESGSSPSIVNFYYNNTKYNVDFNLVGSDYYTEKSLVAPSVSTATNVPFFWEVFLDSGLTVNTTSINQLVSPLLDIEVAETCSAGFFPSFNYTFYDGENRTAITSSTEFYVNFGASGNPDASTVNGSFTNINSFSICVNATSDDYYIGENQIQYGVPDYVERTFYNFNDVQLSNTTTTQYRLYNLLASSSTSFLISVQDAGLTPQNDKYVSMLRFYPEIDEYQVVEMGRTNEGGQTPMKTVPEDVDYRFGVYEKNGTLLKLTEPLRMVCLVNPCELTITLDEDVDFSSFAEVEYTLVYNETTNKFKFTWNDPNQLTTLMNLTVYKQTTYSESVVCESTGTGFTGIITCDVTGQTGLLRAVVERSASPAITIATLIKDASTSIIDVGGGSLGLFLSFVLVAFVGLAGAISPIVAVISGIVALIPALFLGNITITILIALATMGWIVIHMMRKT